MVFNCPAIPEPDTRFTFTGYIVAPTMFDDVENSVRISAIVLS